MALISKNRTIKRENVLFEGTYLEEENLQKEECFV